MIKLNSEKVQVEEMRPVSKEFYCDVCKRCYAKKSLISSTKNTNYVGYYKIITGHNDWGNDSCESIETREVCSEICMYQFFDEYVINTKGSGTAYINIEKQIDICLDDNQNEVQ